MLKFKLFVFIIMAISILTIHGDAHSVQAPCGCQLNCIIVGDVDQNGTINVSDLMSLANYLAGNVSLNSNQRIAANTFKDGTIDILDLYTLANYLAGNIHSLPVTPN